MTQTGITHSSQAIDGMDATVWTLDIDGEQVAHLDIHTSGLILNVEVDTDHRGEGHARALYEAATTVGTVYHVPAWGRTPEGGAFAEAMGGDTMDDQTACDILGLDLDTVTGALWA
jgi:hypothetical protein